MCSPKKGHGTYQPPSNFAPRKLPELEIPGTIRDDILHTKILASKWVISESQDTLEDAKVLLKRIMESIEKMKNDGEGPEQDDDTWTLKAYNEIATVYGLLKMTEQEKEISNRLLVNMEERRGPDDWETLLIVERDALRHWDWGNLEDAVSLFERAQEKQSKSSGEDSIHVIINTLFLEATAMALSLKYAGEGKTDLSAEKNRLSAEASKRVAVWELSGNVGEVPDAYFLLQATRQMIQEQLHKTFKSGLIHPSIIPKHPSY